MSPYPASEGNKLGDVCVFVFIASDSQALATFLNRFQYTKWSPESDYTDRGLARCGTRSQNPLDSNARKETSVLLGEYSMREKETFAKLNLTNWN